MTGRELAKALLPPIVLAGLRRGRNGFRALGAPAAALPAWGRVGGGVLAGHELRLPAGERWADAMLSGAYEPAVTSVLVRSVGVGDVCYDLGAHLGWYSLVMARCAGPGGVVHAFEPYAPNAARLREHAARNASLSERAPIHVHECAVGGETGVHDLVGSGDADSVSTLSHLAGTRGVLDPGWRRRFDGFPRERVQVWRLDDWRAKSGAPPPRVIKLDVEGSELEALRGARETLAAACPVVLAELHNAALAAGCGAFLGALGYGVEVIVRESAADCIVLATPIGAGGAGGG